MLFFLLSIAVAQPDFTEIAPGISYAELIWEASPSLGDGKLIVVRLDPKRAKLRMHTSGDATANRTAREWASELDLCVVVNAGMYDVDHLTHVGRFRTGLIDNQADWNTAYSSVFTVGPGAAATIIDTDLTSKVDYTTADHLVQNLRLIRAPGENRWKPNGKKWSEAALARDAKGRILFLFSRTPYQMHDFNKRLLASGLEVVQAQHLEGGPEASLTVRTKTVDRDFNGSFETGFTERDDIHGQWRLPNIIGASCQ
jgi:hypothetical protein